jgi:hypothetical protein
MRIHFTIVLLCIIILSSCSKSWYVFTSFREPANEGLRLLYSKDARHWNRLDSIFLVPGVGKQKVMRDPSVVKGPDDSFHMVWTSSWQGDKGFGYASSKDLIHWTPQQFIPVMQHEPTTFNVWAPELYYDQDSSRYIIVWASCIPGRFEKGIEADSNNHRLYYTTTKDFNQFTPTKLFLDPGFSVIDAVIVRRAKNDFVLVLKDNTRPERNLKIAFGSSAIGPWSAASAKFSDKFTEGPSVVKDGEDWLIYFDAYQDKSYQAVSTKDFKSFTVPDPAISIPEGHKHGTIFQTNKKTIRRLLKYTSQ